MSRTTRTLLILLLLGGGSIVALGWIAGRYGALLDQRRSRAAAADGAGDERAAAEALVASFIRVRTELRRALDPEGDGPPSRSDDALLPELLERRERVLGSEGLAREEYLRVRAVYRDWKRRNLAAGEPLALPLERNRARLEAVDLGAYETLDL